MSVFILSHAGDVHAHAVQWACNVLKEPSVFVDLYELFEQSRIGIVPEAGKQRIFFDGVELKKSASVWLRRPNPPTLFKAESVHPDDLKFAQLSSTQLYRGFLEALSECQLVVSPWTAHAQASLKMNQIKVAQTVGLITPKTIFTNDAELACGYVESGNFIAKRHGQFKWASSDGKCTRTPSVSPVEVEHIRSHSETMPYAPFIIQERLWSTDEIRVFVFGRTIFAVSLGFSNLDGELDWRRFHKNLDISLIELPLQLQFQIFEFMDMLNLKSGAFDFIRTETGEVVFLEVNSCGQWIWMEIDKTIPILDAFTHFLISGDPNFEYDFEQKGSIRYQDFLGSDLAESLYSTVNEVEGAGTPALRKQSEWFSSIVAIETQAMQ